MKASRSDYDIQYKFVDYAREGAISRNNVVELSSICNYEGKKDSYLSLFRYSEEYQDYCKSTHSVKKYNGKCWIEHLPFDVDNKFDLNIALQNTRTLLNRIEAIGIPAGACKCFFSGSKGFHVLVPSSFFGGFEPSEELRQTIKRLAIEIGGDLIDINIYNNNMLFRIENTVNGKSGLYKISLTHEEIMTLDIEEIKKLAETTRQNVHAETEVFCVDAARQLLEKALKPIPKKQKTGDSVTRTGIQKPCIQTLLEGVSESERNNAGIRLASHFRKNGDTVDAAKIKLDEWNLKNSPPLECSEIDTIVTSAYSDAKAPYDYGCNDSILQKYCQPSCRLKKDSSAPCVLAPTIGDTLPAILSMFEKRAKGEIQAVQSPWSGLNGVLLGGFWPGLYTVVGTPGAGKSQFALQIALIAARAGHPVYYVSLEMDRAGITARLIGLMQNKKWSHILTGSQEIENKEAIEDAFRSLPIHVQEAPPQGWSPDDFQKESTAFVSQYPSSDKTPIIIVDYLQLIRGKNNEDIRARLSNTAYMARAIARDQNAVVLLISSTSREHYENLGNNNDLPSDPTSLLKTGKESGDIEYSSDAVLVLTQSPWTDQSPAAGRDVKLAIAKLRHGSPGWVDLHFDGNRFTEPEKGSIAVPGKSKSCQNGQRVKR